MKQVVVTDPKIAIAPAGHAERRPRNRVEIRSAADGQGTGERGLQFVVEQSSREALAAFRH